MNSEENRTSPFRTNWRWRWKFNAEIIVSKAKRCKGKGKGEKETKEDQQFNRDESLTFFSKQRSMIVSYFIAKAKIKDQNSRNVTLIDQPDFIWEETEEEEEENILSSQIAPRFDRDRVHGGRAALYAVEEEAKRERRCGISISERDIPRRWLGESAPGSLQRGGLRTRQD